MEKPSDIAMELYGLGWLHGLYIDYRQTGADTAETFVKISGSNGNAEGLWRSYREYLDLTPSHNSICKLKEKYDRQITEWKKFEKENANDLAEYKRLREKFGDATP